MANASVTDKTSPVYVPWKSFSGYIAGLSRNGIPHSLDNSVKPKSMAGGLWTQILSALRFLSLINDNNVVTNELRSFAGAYGTDEWSQAIKEHILPAYEKIIDNLPLENATAGQLNDRFKKNAQIDGQMLQKCVRFYLHALKESGVKYSGYFAMREQSKTPRKRSATSRTAKKHSGSDNRHNQELNRDDTPEDMIDFKVPFGDIDGLIRVPRGIQTNQFPVFKAFVDAIEKMAEQNSGEQTE